MEPAAVSAAFSVRDADWKNDAIRLRHVRRIVFIIAALQGRYWNVRGILAHFFHGEAVTPYTRARTLFDQVGDVQNSVVASSNLA